jgi:WhiB family redox-sensing transcriptional regulator
VTSNTGRWAGEHSRNRPRSTDVRQTITRSHERPRSRRLDWLSQARCKGQPTGIFFAADNERGMKLRRKEWLAKQICRSCPVLGACRGYALDAQEPYGIWGALTPSERLRLLTNDC